MVGNPETISKRAWGRISSKPTLARHCFRLARQNEDARAADAAACIDP
jgi:hypothetical protein